MKTPILLAICFGISVTMAQDQQAEEKTKEKKIETIKIVDGDTILHEIRLVKGDASEMRWHGKDHRVRVNHEMKEMDGDLDSMIKELNVYMTLDDDHKKMVFRRMSMHDEDLDEVIREMESDEDIIIEMDRGNKQTKIIRIEMSDGNKEEVRVIDMDHSNKGRKKGEPRREIVVDQKGDPNALHVFPNPSSGKMTIQFVLENDDKAELTVTDASGKTVFTKEYKKAGNYTENIDFSGEKKGVFIVNLNQKRRSETSKIILE